MFFVPLMWCIFHLGGMINGKIKRGIHGRTDLFDTLQRGAALLRGTHRVWFHASSMGEFEQAKPIISVLKKKYQHVDIIATFFSPSGYDHSRNYKLADIISYIPFDSAANAERFIEIIRPTVAVMVRYDIWPNMVWVLQEKKIPVMIANATMEEKSARLLPLIKSFHTSLYNSFSHILTVSERDKKAFQRFGTTHPVIEAIGDTRFDQVLMRSNEAATKVLLPQHITNGKKIFIVGQSWEEDEEVILPVLFKLQKIEHDLLTIIVPHEPTIDHLETLEYQLETHTSCIRFSLINNYNQEKVILVDSIGILVALYKYASLVYVGGSFQQGVHNVLEPAIFSNPVLFGPKHTNSQEAVELAKRRGAFIIDNERDLYRILRSLLDNYEERMFAGAIAEDFVRKNCGATVRFLTYIEPFLSNVTP